MSDQNVPTQSTAGNPQPEKSKLEGSTPDNEVGPPMISTSTETTPSHSAHPSFSSLQGQEVDMTPLERDFQRELVASPDSLKSRPNSRMSSPTAAQSQFNHSPFPLRQTEPLATTNMSYVQGRGNDAPTSPTNSHGNTIRSPTSSRPNSMAMNRLSGASAFSHLPGHRPAPPSPGPSRRASSNLGGLKEESETAGGAGGNGMLRARSGSKSSLGGSSTSAWSSAALSRKNSMGNPAGNGGGRARPPSQLIPPTEDDTDVKPPGPPSRTFSGTASSTPSRVPSPVEEHPDADISTSESPSGLRSTSSFFSSSNQSVPPQPRQRLQVIIRDYAFPIKDERYHGRPSLHLSVSDSTSRSAASSDIEDYSASPAGFGGGTARGERRKSSFGGWGGFSLGGFGWGSLKGSNGKGNKQSRGDLGDGGSGGALGLAKGGGTGGSSSSEQQFQRFGATDMDDLDLSSDMTPSSSYGLGEEDSDGFLSGKQAGFCGRGGSNNKRGDESGFQHDGEEELIDDEYDPHGDHEAEDLGPEPKGLYKAVYPFEAEGEPEMSVGEGEVVRIKGRGGGSGWVVGVRFEIGQKGEEVDLQEGLVPESYLEAVEQ